MQMQMILDDQMGVVEEVVDLGLEEASEVQKVMQQPQRRRQLQQISHQDIHLGLCHQLALVAFLWQPQPVEEHKLLIWGHRKAKLVSFFAFCLSFADSETKPKKKVS